VVSIAPARSDAAGRWLAVDVEGPHGRKVIPFEELRRRLSPTALLSSAIVSTWPRAGQPISAGVSFTGRGRGHGVGLCQSGALVYAQRGENARAILQRYYPGAEVVDGR
jgi:SpoIID/LytB domain protein